MVAEDVSTLVQVCRRAVMTPIVDRFRRDTSSITLVLMRVDV
jgi:hypothetical protein